MVRRSGVSEHGGGWMWNRHPDCAKKVSEQVSLDREPKDTLGHQLCIAVFLGGSGDKAETQGRESLAQRASDHLLLMCCQVLFPVGLSGFTNNTVHKLTQRSSCILGTLACRLQWIARRHRKSQNNYDLFLPPGSQFS